MTTESNESDAIVEGLRTLLAEADQARRACAESEDCDCSYKDCYECGKWHSCHHNPWTAIRDLLSIPPGLTANEETE